MTNSVKKINQLLKLADEFDDYKKDVDIIMNKGLPPRQMEMGSEMILSNYKLADADIYFTFAIHESKDTMAHQYDALAKRNRNCVALLIWPNYDMLVEYDNQGSPMSGDS